MPITQSRVIALVSTADTLVNTIDTLKQLAERVDVEQNIMTANAAIDHVADEPTREAIRFLLQSTMLLHEAIDNIDVPIAVRTNIIEERIHFKQHKRQNEITANYMRAKRSREREAQLSLLQMPIVPFAAPAQAQTQAQAPSTSPSPAPTKLTMAERIAKRKANASAAQSADEIIATGPMAVPEAVPEANGLANGLRPATYDPDVVATSLPTLAELNEVPIPVGKNVF